MRLSNRIELQKETMSHFIHSTKNVILFKKKKNLKLKQKNDMKSFLSHGMYKKECTTDDSHLT